MDSRRVTELIKENVAYCEGVGFRLIGSDVVTTRKGKIAEGDLYPLDENDCSEDRTVYFVKE